MKTKNDLSVRQPVAVALKEKPVKAEITKPANPSIPIPPKPQPPLPRPAPRPNPCPTPPTPPVAPKPRPTPVPNPCPTPTKLPGQTLKTIKKEINTIKK